MGLSNIPSIRFLYADEILGIIIVDFNAVNGRKPDFGVGGYSLDLHC
jgi:hypothetical protein